MNGGVTLAGKQKLNFLLLCRYELNFEFFQEPFFALKFIQNFFTVLLYSTLLHLSPIVSEDAGIKPRTVATLALAVRRSNHLARLGWDVSCTFN